MRAVYNAAPTFFDFWGWCVVRVIHVCVVTHVIASQVAVVSVPDRRGARRPRVGVRVPLASGHVELHVHGKCVVCGCCCRGVMDDVQALVVTPGQFALPPTKAYAQNQPVSGVCARCVRALMASIARRSFWVCRRAACGAARTQSGRASSSAERRAYVMLCACA
jgi:hypothetical protein